MDSWVRLNAQSQSKEKLIRASQYGCMVLGYFLQRSRAAPDLHRTISELEKHLSLTRKLLRLGNSVEALQAAKRSIHLSDGVLRLCLTISYLNRALYFACDNVLWAKKTRVLSKLDERKWSERSFRYYLFSLILNLTRDVYELCLLVDCETRARTSKFSSTSLLADRSSSSSPSSPAALPLMAVGLQQRLHHVATILYNNPALSLDLLKNSCDIFIPLDRLGIYRTGPGFVGTCGLVSSILSLLSIVHPWLKLKP